MTKAILIISHGSRSSKTIDEIKALVSQIRHKTPVGIVEYAFLELAEPSISEGVDRCVEQGAMDVHVLLNFLNAGRHVDEDIPTIINACREKHPNVRITISKPVGQHPAIPELFLDLIQ